MHVRVWVCVPVEEEYGSAWASLCLQGMVLGVFGRAVHVCVYVCVCLCLPALVSHPRA